MGGHDPNSGYCTEDECPQPQFVMDGLYGTIRNIDLMNLAQVLTILFIDDCCYGAPGSI